MPTLSPTDRRLRSAEFNLEIGNATPNLRLIMSEIEQAQSDASRYYTRNDNAFQAWHARWPEQYMDGRKHANEDGSDPFPWIGASDVRIRTCATTIREHVMVSKIALRRARIQKQSVRPLASQRDSQQGTRLLQWLVGTLMRSQRRREESLALNWKWGYGLGIMCPEWDVSMRLDYHEIAIPDIDEVIQAQGQDPAIIQFMEALFDPAKVMSLVQQIQQWSPIVSTRAAQKILEELRLNGKAKIPVPIVFHSMPKWTALRAGVDLLFAGDLSDLQQARAIFRREWVHETTLKDRIQTRLYDPGFVDEALKHKGDTSNDTWLQRTNAERLAYAEDGESSYSPGLSDTDQEKQIELIYAYYKATDRGVPCVYQTVFNPHCMGRNRKDPVYATHGPHPYAHGLYPFVEMPRQANERPILSSIGIAEEAYTLQQVIKRQIDGLNDRTDMELQPPMVVPHSRVRFIQNTPMPRAVLGATRPQELRWMEPPPMGETPILVVRLVQDRLDRDYPLFPGKESGVDDALTQAYREEVVGDTLEEFSLILRQTDQLAQQYLTEEEVTAVVGPLHRPWPWSKEESRRQYSITAVFDPQMLDADYKEKKLTMLGMALGSFNQMGQAKMDFFFRAAIEILDIDWADAGIEETETATNKEKTAAKADFAMAMGGVEPDYAMHANHGLRLQTFQELIQANPHIDERLAKNPDSAELLKNLVKFHENQLQQYTQNPSIGRALATKAFNPRLAPALKA